MTLIVPSFQGLRLTRVIRGRSELARACSFVFYKTYASLRVEAERTYIGILWWVLEPLASLLVYYLVFSVILKRGTENYVAFLFVGLVPWRWFQATVMRGAAAILSAKSLMQQVYLPKLVFPAVTFLTDTFKFLVVFTLLLVVVVAWGFPVGAAYFALPMMLLVQGLLVAALTTLAAATTPFLPDLRLILQNLLRLWFFLSGVFYDIDVFPPATQVYLRLNPMAVLLESYRAVLLDGRWPDLFRLGVIGLLSALVLAAAMALTLRYDHVYPKLKL